MMTPRLSRRAACRGARRVAVAHSGAARRLRQRPHDAPAAAARAARPRRGRSTSTSSARRRRLSASCTRVTARRRRSRSPTRRRGAGSAAGGVRRDARIPRRARARRPASRRRSCSTNSSSCARSRAFPGLRRVLHELVDGLAASGNRFVLTSRYTARALRLLRDRSARFEVIHMPPLTRRRHARHARPAMAARRRRAATREFLARTVHALADGRPAYVRALADELAAMREHGGPAAATPISALAALLAADGRAREQCALLLRAAPAPRARLRRAQGHPRDPRAKTKG